MTCFWKAFSFSKFALAVASESSSDSAFLPIRSLRIFLCRCSTSPRRMTMHAIVAYDKNIGFEITSKIIGKMYHISEPFAK